jgi:hypothetical protein
MPRIDLSRFRRGLLVAVLLSLLLAISTQHAFAELVQAATPANPREGWAALLDMNDYPAGYTDLPTGYKDSQAWMTTLQAFGWQSSHIMLVRDTLTRSTGETALQFLIGNADANDIVLFFIFAHETWIRNSMDWSDWFPSMWTAVASQNKLLVVASCGAEEFIDAVNGETAPHVHIASVSLGEYAWAGLPEEGLPVIGEVFNQFFTAAFSNVSADANADGEVTVEEAFRFASPASRTYITSEVFPNFPDYAQMSNQMAPHPVLVDAYPGNLSLRVELGIDPVSPISLLTLGLVGLAISVAVVVPLAWMRWRSKSRGESGS